MSDEICILARLSIGEACEEGNTNGSLIVQQDADGKFSVFVNGGMLPDGDDCKRFDRPVQAMKYALAAVAEFAHEYLEDFT